MSVNRLTVLSSYPKSGNTWLRAFLESLRAGGATIDINANMAGICPAADRAMFNRTLGKDATQLQLGELIWLRPQVWRQVAEAEIDPPWIKTHDALLAPFPKAAPMFPADVIKAAVYIVRDPRDVAISFAHHFAISIDDAIACLADPKLFLDLPGEHVSDQLPQFVSSWSAHVTSWLDAPDLHRHLVRYEDMHAAPESTFAGVARFLDLDVSPEAVERAVVATRFGELRKQEDRHGFRERDATTAQFFRRGEAGGWRDTLTADQAARIEQQHGAVMQRLGYGP